MDAGARISLYGTLFYVFLAITVLGVALAVFCYFYFNIPVVYAMMTGKAKQETIRKMTEQNAKTGNLRTVYGFTDETKNRKTEPVHKAEVVQPTPQPAAVVYETSVLQTESLETSLLRETTDETVVLNAPVVQEVSKEAAADFTGYRFEVTETTLVIHTNEII